MTQRNTIFRTFQVHPYDVCRIWAVISTCSCQLAFDKNFRHSAGRLHLLTHRTETWGFHKQRSKNGRKKPWELTAGTKTSPFFFKGKLLNQQISMKFRKFQPLICHGVLELVLPKIKAVRNNPFRSPLCTATINKHQRLEVFPQFGLIYFWKKTWPK